MPLEFPTRLTLSDISRDGSPFVMVSMVYSTGVAVRKCSGAARMSVCPCTSQTTALAFESGRLAGSTAMTRAGPLNVPRLLSVLRLLVRFVRQ